MANLRKLILCFREIVEAHRPPIAANIKSPEPALHRSAAEATSALPTPRLRPSGTYL